MNLASFLWGIAAIVLGAIAGAGTLFFFKVGENFYSWAQKKLNPKAPKK